MDEWRVVYFPVWWIGARAANGERTRPSVPRECVGLSQRHRAWQDPLLVPLDQGTGDLVFNPFSLASSSWMHSSGGKSWFTLAERDPSAVSPQSFVPPR